MPLKYVFKYEYMVIASTSKNHLRGARAPGLR